MPDDVARILERIAQESYAKLLAYLAGRFRRDIQAAEDALADAFASALRSWPKSCVPEHPEAWLLKVACNRLIDLARKQQRFPETSVASISDNLSETNIATYDPDPEAIPDERLQMMFACAHPAIDPNIRTALLLQVVLGISAERISSAFLVSPKTLSQRLVRGKTKIRLAGISFQIPERESLEERSQTVLEAIYAAFVIGWDGVEPGSQELVADGVALARIVVDCLPDNPEARGLLALLLYCEARQQSRRSVNLEYIPLDEQEPSRWDAEKLDEAEDQLRRASTLNRSGRFQLEAAIQSAHMQRRDAGQTPWRAIIELYGAILNLSPTVGIQIARAAAFAKSGDTSSALIDLNTLNPDVVREHQPYWAVRAEVLRQRNNAECLAAYERAMGLSIDPAVRAYLQRRKATCLTG